MKVELSVDPEALMCSTVIHVNDTHTMRGQQEIEVVPQQPQTINFGLMPPNVDPQIPMTHAGFQVRQFFQISLKYCNVAVPFQFF